MNENAIEIQDFELENTDQINTAVDPLDELVSFQFKEDELFDMQKYSSIIKGLKSVNKDELKLLEAENIIRDLGPKYLNAEYNESLIKTKESLENFIYKFRKDGNEMAKIEMTEVPDKGKDEVYEIANFLFNNFIGKLNNMEYTMELSQDEFKFLNTTLRQKIHYDSNEAINIVTLIPKLDGWQEYYKKLTKNTAPTFMINVNIKEVVMIYHFISKYQVKGIGEELHNLVTFITKIGETNKIFNAYNIIKDRLGNSFKDWTTSITVEGTGINPTSQFNNFNTVQDEEGVQGTPNDK